MSYQKTTYILALFTAIAILSGSGFKIGPAKVRLFDIGVVILVIAFVFSSSKLQFRRDYLFFYIVFGGLLAYSVFLLPVQSYSRTTSILQIIELAEYLVIFSVFSSFLINKDAPEHELILNTALWLTAIGSGISSVAFITLGVRPVTQWYVFGFLAFGTYYATAKYVTQNEWYYLIAMIIIFINIVVRQSRSIYIFFPLAALLTLIIKYPSRGSPTAFSKQKIAILLPFGGVPAVGAIIVSPQIKARLISIIQLSQGFLARPARWLAGVSVYKRYPFGIGLGNYATAVQDLAIAGSISYPDWFIKLFTPHRIRIEINKYQAGHAGPHSDLFRLLIELGFIGAGLLVIFWIFLAKKIFSYSSDPISLSLIATMIYLVLQQFVNSHLFAGQGGIVLVVFFAVFSTYELTSNE